MWTAGRHSVRLLELGDPDYKAYQGLVAGLIEFIDMPHAGTVCCNEESKLIGLRPNIRVTGLLYLLRPEYIGQHFIAGDVVLLGQPNDEGETTSAPELYVRLLSALPPPY
jgi:hypothetical protein